MGLQAKADEVRCREAIKELRLDGHRVLAYFDHRLSLMGMGLDVGSVSKPIGSRMRSYILVLFSSQLYGELSKSNSTRLLCLVWPWSVLR